MSCPCGLPGNYQAGILKFRRPGNRKQKAGRGHVPVYLTRTPKHTRKLANALTSMGAEVGDRIGVLAWNTYENYEIYFGMPGTGAVMLLLNLRLSPPDLGYVINHAKAKYIIVDETLLPIAEAGATGIFDARSTKHILENADKVPLLPLQPGQSYPHRHLCQGLYPSGRQYG